jgi:eukaryotic-like serine/threonine-protein kinase
MSGKPASKTPTIRTEAPRIPDHQVLRCIGRGSYGEVWLARSVTGSLRAVKVVRREDFELERTFEREFEGIKRFEPISRDHSGLVHVLHVGRNDEEGFYYYVMELGDDRETGGKVEPGDYEARTMGTDRSMKHRLPVKDCIDHGAILADALAHLHTHNLTHRDIKPSNIIFVNGKPKLADIGLVAATGQMTFVGTEGFVPPEGPGTAQADIYSLGMVLYELSTGCDRLQFPELPNDMGAEAGRPQWRALNDVICKACAPQPKKRYVRAEHMAHALRAARKKRSGGGFIRRVVKMAVVTGVLAFALVTWRHGGAMPWPPGKFMGGTGSFLPITGAVSFTSQPDGVDVVFEGKVVGRTPCTAEQIPAGSAIFTLRRARHRDASVSVSGVAPGQTVPAQHVVMEFYDPPRSGQPWSNSLGMEFDPRATNQDHLSRLPVSAEQFRNVVPDIMELDYVVERGQGGEILQHVRVTPREAVRFCEQLARRDVEQGFLPEGYCYRAEPYAAPVPEDEDPEVSRGRLCFRLVAEPTGRLTVMSEPAGAGIYEDEVKLEVTPFTVAQRRTGPVELVLRLQGYQDATVTGNVESGKTLTINTVLKPSLMPVPRKPWVNSLGAPFQPVEDVWFAACETRLQDYAEFAKETGRPPGIVDANSDGVSDLGQDATHPVLNITRADAVAYCQWLTGRERASSHLPQDMEYRLPTDAEWSLAAGISGDDQLSDPASRHNRWRKFYPWLPDTLYPPASASADQPAAANLGDLTALRSKEKALGPLTSAQVREMEELRYTDGYVFTAPSGKTRPGPAGLYDLSGNVWEFVADNYGGSDPARAGHAVSRGASWAEPVTNNIEIFWNQYRRTSAPGQEADNRTGFRAVVAPVRPAN